MYRPQISGGTVKFDSDPRSVFEQLRRMDLYWLLLANDDPLANETLSKERLVMIAQSHPKPLYNIDGRGMLSFSKVDHYIDQQSNSIRIVRPVYETEEGVLLPVLEPEKPAFNTNDFKKRGRPPK